MIGLWGLLLSFIPRKAANALGNDDFNRAMDFAFRWEGGLVDDPDDPGGLTNYGISLSAHQDLGRDGIRGMTKEKAAEIYRKEYWDTIGGDDLPWPVNLATFDAGINCGVPRALVFLKRAMESAKGSREKALIVCNLRMAYYTKLIFKNSKMSKYKKGWTNRVTDLERVIKTT